MKKCFILFRKLTNSNPILQPFLLTALLASLCFIEAYAKKHPELERLEFGLKYGDIIRLNSETNYLCSHSFFDNTDPNAPGLQQVFITAETGYGVWWNSLWIIKGPFGTTLDDINPVTGQVYRGSFVQSGDVVSFEHWKTQKMLQSKKPAVMVSEDAPFPVNCVDQFSQSNADINWLVMVMNQINNTTYQPSTQGSVWTNKTKVNLLHHQTTKDKNVQFINPQNPYDKKYFASSSKKIDVFKTDNPASPETLQVQKTEVANKQFLWNAQTVVLPTLFTNVILPSDFVQEASMAHKVAVGQREKQAEIWMIYKNEQDAGKKLYRYTRSKPTQHPWEFIAATRKVGTTITAIKDVDVGSDGTVCIVDEQGNGHRYLWAQKTFEPLVTQSADPKMQGKNITLDQIAVGSAGNIWGLNKTNKVAYQLTQKGWNSRAENIIDVSVGDDGTTVAVNSTNDVYTYENNAWNQMKNIKLSSIGVDNRNDMFGSFFNEKTGVVDIYHYQQNSWTRLRNVEQNIDVLGLARISASNGVIFATDVFGNIYTNAPQAQEALIVQPQDLAPLPAQTLPSDLAPLPALQVPADIQPPALTVPTSGQVPELAPAPAVPLVYQTDHMRQKLKQITSLEQQKVTQINSLKEFDTVAAIISPITNHVDLNQATITTTST
ncbi:MAG: hypothetical protein H6679_00440 [Epsilonproteobacteria bacterium]|nr:hypothetical protein [Campylobacterota bacterium]